MTKADKRENIIMIASEPLTFERSDWMEVKTNTMMVITPKVRVSYVESMDERPVLTRLLFSFKKKKMNLLQIPIIDEYWVPPQDPASLTRSRDFAIKRGYGLGFASEEAAKHEIAATT